jgi:hypothetical protein
MSSHLAASSRAGAPTIEGPSSPRGRSVLSQSGVRGPGLSVLHGVVVVTTTCTVCQHFDFELARAASLERWRRPLAASRQ